MANLSNNKLKTNNTLFDNNDILFKKYLMKSNVFAEYGCGQSTYWLLKNTTAQILSVDTSIDWINTIKQSKVYEEQKIKLKYIDVGKVENWGFPIDYSKRDSFIDYTNWVWKQNLIPDTVLIDGRFRVCCFFTCLKFAKDGTIIIFDDYFDRPYYHIVEKYLRVHQKCGRQAIFKIFNKKKFDSKIIDTEIKNFRHVLN
jgi:hypothetical protein